MMNREEFVVTGLKENLQTRKTSHAKDIARALKILIIVLLLLLLFGKLVLVVYRLHLNVSGDLFATAFEAKFGYSSRKYSISTSGCT